MGPTLAGFIAFLRASGIAVAYLPDNAAVIATAYSIATALVNAELASLPSGDPTQPTLYTLAVYNLAADRVVNYADDVADSTFFTDLRARFSIATFIPGVTASSGDSGTSQSRLNPEFMSQLTMRDLQTLKTPYGRAYMEIAHDYGPSIWGIS